MSANKIKFLVMDVDGTLTDGKIYMGINGEIMKSFDVKDGYAINDLLPRHGIKPVILTGRRSEIVENRAKELGIEFVFQKVKDKLCFLKEFAVAQKVTLEEIAFIGDDLNDFECIKFCGISGCPNDAVNEIKSKVDFISAKNGGNGALREFAEYIVEITGDI